MSGSAPPHPVRRRGLPTALATRGSRGSCARLCGMAASSKPARRCRPRLSRPSHRLPVPLVVEVTLSDARARCAGEGTEAAAGATGGEPGGGEPNPCEPAAPAAPPRADAAAPAAADGGVAGASGPRPAPAASKLPGNGVGSRIARSPLEAPDLFSSSCTVMSTGLVRAQLGKNVALVHLPLFSQHCRPCNTGQGQAHCAVCDASRRARPGAIAYERDGCVQPRRWPRWQGTFRSLTRRCWPAWSRTRAAMWRRSALGCGCAPALHRRR